MGEMVRFKRPLGLPERWEDEQLMVAVRAYVFGGDVGEILGVGELEVGHWVRSRQWQELVRMVMPEVREVMAAQLVRIGNRALSQLDERLERGDPVLGIDGSPKVVEGKAVYRPLKARDLADIAMKVMDQRRALEAKVGPVVDEEGKISLVRLAESLKRYGEEKVRIIEAQVVQ